MKRNIIITKILTLLLIISCTKSVDLETAEIGSCETLLQISVIMSYQESNPGYINHAIKLFTNYNDFIDDINEIAVSSVRAKRETGLYNGCGNLITQHEIVIDNPEGTECWIKCIRTDAHCRDCQFGSPYEIKYKKSVYIPDVPVFKIYTTPEDWECNDEYYCCH